MSGHFPRLVIVTGGDSGIGQATATLLASEGFDIGLTCHEDTEGVRATAREIETRGQRCFVEPFDAASPEAGTVVDRLADRLGGLGVLVNVAGTGHAEKVLDLPFDRWRQVLATDLDGPFLCAQAAARVMVAAGEGGRIINVTSVHEHQPRVGAAAYCAAKGGLGLLTKVAALELSEHGITVNSVAPGEIATPMTGQEDEDPTAPGHERPGIPLRRPGDAREVAAVVAFLASPEAAYVTGASWAIDGGMLQMGPMAGSHLTSDDWRSP
jgi:NAD(P)-dependent dehydrogenase (short-subunit alcohol dehydrogenase family)